METRPEQLPPEREAVEPYPGQHRCAEPDDGAVGARPPATDEQPGADEGERHVDGVRREVLVDGA